ncbi:MAG: DNA-processing protein DprA [Candidatus Tyrphobacter sp.]
MEPLRYLGRAEIEDLRGERGFAAKAEGLWCCGDPKALERACVAIVGTRSATAYGRRLAGIMATDLARAGCCIVSGLALGIDACAHAGALEARAPTIGVLGSGHRRFFPRANEALARRMVEAGGAVLSPFPPEEPAYPSRFLQRNGIVAALADAVVVVEAPARSGALNTAGWAAGRVPVLAVPGDVDRRHSAGCLALIRDGATLARDANDVLEALGDARLPLQAAHPPIADPLAGAIAELLLDGERDLDAIVSAVQAPVPAVLAALAMLEIDGVIEVRGPARYARR